MQSISLHDNDLRPLQFYPQNLKLFIFEILNFSDTKDSPDYVIDDKDSWSKGYTLHLGFIGLCLEIRVCVFVHALLRSVRFSKVTVT